MDRLKSHFRSCMYVCMMSSSDSKQCSVVLQARPLHSWLSPFADISFQPSHPLIIKTQCLLYLYKCNFYEHRHPYIQHRPLNTFNKSFIQLSASLQLSGFNSWILFWPNISYIIEKSMFGITVTLNNHPTIQQFWYSFF